MEEIELTGSYQYNMTVEFKLSVDKKTGEPIIKFRHHERSKDLRQLLLGLFFKEAFENNLAITRSLRFTGKDECYQDYVIKVKDKESKVPVCKKCGTEAILSKAIHNDHAYFKPNSLGAREFTKGKAHLIDCFKCPDCGHSWT